MAFSSLTFLFYLLPLFIIISAFVPKRLDNLLLFLFSIVFYFWGEPFPVLLFLLIFSIVANYFCGLFIGWSRGSIKKMFLAAGILGNLSILFLFKYLQFTTTAIESILNISIFIPHISGKELVLPLGLSFVTFKVMSYIIDVYRGGIPAEKNLLRLATYISMFPLITAGPIIRYESVMKELYERALSREGLFEGVKLLIIGLLFKSILANQFSIYADMVFSQQPEFLSIHLAWLGAICYTLQIYFDFAGYSIMAIGLGKMMGFNFPDNFNLPYVSQSVTEFWRRWHITLASWFRDYLYIPLGGNRKGNLITYCNLFIVFLLCGLWHGANYTFIVWGIYHGAFLAIERFFRNHGIKIPAPRILKHIYLLTEVTVGWVFFRSENLDYALHYIGLMFGAISGNSFIATSMNIIYQPLILVLLLGIVFSMIDEKGILEFENRIKSNAGLMLKFGCYSMIFLLSVVMLLINTHKPFIYQQF